MSLLGVDVGTTGCKAALFTEKGQLIASSYREYDILRPQPGWAELDAADIWSIVQNTIREAVSGACADPVRALSISSLGEALVPVSRDREILGPSILNFDVRGEAFLPALAAAVPAERLYRINGNTLGNQFSLTKLKWIQAHQSDLYDRAYRFLPWSSFIAYMLGAPPVVDHSLANRTLLFDVDRECWSEELLSIAGIDGIKLGDTAPSGTEIGRMSTPVAKELGLPPGVSIVTGAHDQCANAVGCGVIHEGNAVYGMGTYLCITPVFTGRRDPHVMMESGLNTEHHAAPGRYVTFIYNQGGAMLKWFRDTYAAAERKLAKETGRDIYADLLAEMPAEPSSVLCLPHFAPTGPPEFVSDSSGVLVGLKLETARGDILKGILEGTTFNLKECVDALPAMDARIADFRAVGGGSKSDAWVQLCADILGRPFIRPRVTEAGTLGAAIMAGVGCGLYESFEAGVEAMVVLDRTFEPDPHRHRQYEGRFERYARLWPLMKGYLRELSAHP